GARGGAAPRGSVAGRPWVSDLHRRRARQLLLPVQGYDLRQLRDDSAEKRGARVHEAIDMAAPRGTPVLAVDDGVVQKLFTSAAGGLARFGIYSITADSYFSAPRARPAARVRDGQAARTA